MTPFSILGTELTDTGRTVAVADLHPEVPTSHDVVIPADVLAARVGLYGVSEDNAAELIVWEHYYRLNPAATDDPPAELSAVWGPDLTPLRSTE